MNFWKDDRTLEDLQATPCQWDAVLKAKGKEIAPSADQITAELKMRELEDAAAKRQRQNITHQIK